MPRTPRAGVGSNQYTTRPGARLPRSSSDLSRLSDAVVDDLEDVRPTPTEPLTNIYLAGDQPNASHVILVRVNGTTETSVSCRVHCRFCSDGTHRYQLFRRRHDPWVAAALTTLRVDPFERDDEPVLRALVTGWHRHCGEDCSGATPDPIEAVAWEAAGASTHRSQRRLTARGWTLGHLSDVPVPNLRAWITEGFSFADTVNWVRVGVRSPESATAWRDIDFDGPRSQAWLAEAQLAAAPENIISWAAAFPDEPHQARTWLSQCAVVFGSTAKGMHHPNAAGLCGQLAATGAAPDQLREWRRRISKEVAACYQAAQATGGNLDAAEKIGKSGGAYSIAKIVKACSDDPLAAARWASINVTDTDMLTHFTQQHVTPEQVTAARRAGDAAVPVDGCGEGHHLAVTWKNGRPRWTAPDHDRAAEAVGAAFGGSAPRCEIVLNEAKQMWTKGQTATPGSALASAANPGDTSVRYELPKATERPR